MSDQSYLDCIWRVGRRVGRTIYAQSGEQPSDDDVLIGMMDTRELAEHVCGRHNAGLDVLRPGLRVREALVEYGDDHTCERF